MRRRSFLKLISGTVLGAAATKLPANEEINEDMAILEDVVILNKPTYSGWSDLDATWHSYSSSEKWRIEGEKI